MCFTRCKGGLNLNTILVTNGLQSKSLAVVRSLGKQGLRTIVGEKYLFHPSGFSKYASKCLTYPDPVSSEKLFIDWLYDTLQREQCVMYLPTDDDTMRIAVRLQNKIRQLCALPVPSIEGYQIASDKGMTIKHAMNSGVPCPITVHPWFDVVDYLDSELLRTVQDLSFPMVIKPRTSSGSRGIRIAHTPQELVNHYRIIHTKYPNPIIQEYVPSGIKYDVCVAYAQDHTLKGAFVQKQLRNYPIPRGPSTVRESVHEPLLLHYATTLMGTLDWYGVADVEFIVDSRDGQAKLLEVNPRFWSSLHLAVHCGVDFPLLLYLMAHNEHVEPILNYEAGIIGRSLIPFDILHYITNQNRKNMNPSFWSKQLDDIISMNDPLPTLGVIISMFFQAMNPSMWKQMFRR